MANVYLHRFDEWVKHELRAKYYIRYADDFVLLFQDREWLFDVLPRIRNILQDCLQLTLHPDKMVIKTIASGIDFLGWVHFPDHRVLRTKTKRRMWEKLRTTPTEESLQSYLGILGHGNAQRTRHQLLGEYWLAQG